MHFKLLAYLCACARACVSVFVCKRLPDYVHPSVKMRFFDRVITKIRISMANFNIIF